MLIKYYLKNITLSFFALAVITAVFMAILDYTPEDFVYWGIAAAIGVMFIGLILIGYYNAYAAQSQNFKHTLYLHLSLVIFLLSVELLFGNKELWVNLLRNLMYFIALQIGVYIYMKKKGISWKNHQNSI